MISRIQGTNIEGHLQQNILYICYNLLNLEQLITYFCKITNDSLAIVMTMS